MRNEKILFLTVGCINYDCGINFYEPLTHIFSEVISYNYIEKINNIGREKTNLDIIEITKKETPDYVFLITHLNQIDIAVFDILSNLGTRIIAWFSDDNKRFDNYSKFLAAHIFCSVTTYKCALKKYKEMGLTVIKSQWASNPNHYKKFNSDFLYNVSFVGGKYGKRQEILDYLQTKGINVNVFGKGFNSFTTFDEMIKIFNTSRINLNFSHCPEESLSAQIKARVFEVPMCGGFLLTEYVEGIEEYFEIGKEIECFKNNEEAVEKINYYLKYKEERENIAKAGHIRALKDHTWERRLTDVFNNAEELQYDYSR